MGHQSISTRIPDHTCMNLVSRHDQSTCLHTILVHDLVGCIASFPGSHPELEREPGNIGGIKLWTSGNVIIRVTKEDTPLPEVIFMWLPRATSTYIQWWRLHCMHWLCWHASKFVEVGEYLLAGKFGQILLRDGQSRKMRQSLSDSVPQANDCEQCFPFFLALRPCHTHDSNVSRWSEPIPCWIPLL